jgi:hypothetical protein
MLEEKIEEIVKIKTRFNQFNEEILWKTIKNLIKN